MKGKFLSGIAVTSLLFIFFAEPRIAAEPNHDATIREILRQPFPDQPGTDTVMLTVEYGPGASTPPHEHPGLTYAYVLEGAVISQVGDEKPRTFTRGQTWSELPHQHHVISKNASRTKSAKLLVFLIVPKNEPLLTMLPAETQ